MSPVSTLGSEWSGMNTYNSLSRNDGPYGPYGRHASISPPEQIQQNGFGPPRPTTSGSSTGPLFLDGLQPLQRRRPSDGSLGSSGASIANSISSEGTLSDQHSRKYRRMEMELSQHYTVLRVFLKGSAQQPAKPNKARDKLLRLSPGQFHELSTDVFDELQRRQASSPLPGRPPRRENVPLFLQPRPEFHEKRNQARQKLSSLQTNRFRDLSTDVFCELERRFPHFVKPDSSRRDSSRSQSRGPTGRSTPVNHNSASASAFVPPARTQSYGVPTNSSAGQRCQTSLVDDVPRFDNPPSLTHNDPTRPTPKQFHSNTLMPNKSMMVEDEDEVQGVDSKYDRSSEAFGLESSLMSPASDQKRSIATHSAASSGLGVRASPPRTVDAHQKLDSLGSAFDPKDGRFQSFGNPSQLSEEWTVAKREVERKLADAERLNRSLKEQLDQMQMTNKTLEQDLQARSESQKANTGGHDIWQGKYERLDREHSELQERFKKQENIIAEVSRQGQTYLDEMRAMADSGGDNLDREDKLQADVHKLEEEVKEWKARYVRARAQLRNVRVSSIGLGQSKQDAARTLRDHAFYHADGLVKDFHVTSFQMSIDELLRIARSSEPNSVLDHMKTVVLAVRGITSDIENVSDAKDDDSGSKKRTKLKAKVSATANNVITASKNFAAAGGLSPVSLLDAAASHLTSAVIDLLRTVKIRPTPASEGEDEHEDDNLEPLQSNGYFNVSHKMKRNSTGDSVYTALSTPPNERTSVAQHNNARHGRGLSNYTNGGPHGPGLGIRGGRDQSEHAELQDLKIYLEDQTDGLVESIQFLVGAIRNEESTPSIRDHLAVITDIVGNVVVAVDTAGEKVSSYQISLHRKTNPIIDTLNECRNRLVQAGVDSQTYDTKGSAKEFTQRLPPLAFQIARETKELVARVDQVVNGDNGEDLS